MRDAGGGEGDGRRSMGQEETKERRRRGGKGGKGRSG